MAGYWREYVDWGRHDLLVPPRLICSPRPPGRRWAERVFMYLPGIVSDRSWRQGRIPILYALPVWSAKQPANWPGTSASIRYAVYNACLAMRLRYRIAGSSSLMRRTIWSVGQLMRRSEEHMSELQSLMRISYAVFCLKKKKNISVYTSL